MIIIIIYFSVILLVNHLDLEMKYYVKTSFLWAPKQVFYEHQNTAEINSGGGKVTVKIVMNFHKVPSIRSRLSYHPHLYLPFMFSKLNKLVSEQNF